MVWNRADVTKAWKFLPDCFLFAEKWMVKQANNRHRGKTEDWNHTNSAGGWDVDSPSAKVLVRAVVVSLLENFSNDHEVPWYHTHKKATILSDADAGGLQQKQGIITWIDATWSLAGSDWPASLEDNTKSSLSLISSTKLVETSSESGIPNRLANSVIGDPRACDFCDHHIC